MVRELTADELGLLANRPTGQAQGHWETVIEIVVDLTRTFHVEAPIEVAQYPEPGGRMTQDDSGPTHHPDPLLARQVEAMAGYGVPAESIALVCRL